MNLELRTTGAVAVHPDFHQVDWGSPDSESGIQSSVDSWLSQIGPVSDAAVDFARLVGAAYVADRLARRGAGFSRTLRLHVQLVDAARWTPLLHSLSRLLTWVSGDVWELTATTEEIPRPTETAQAALTDPQVHSVALLSGGLDSFSGAVLDGMKGLYLSHTDNPTVTGAQTRVWQWLTSSGATGERVRISFSEASGKKENTTRTRALLFYALAIALADARGLGSVEIPENGFTGLNISLGNDRGGVLSTRSTHPWTMHLVQELMNEAGLSIQLSNPYEWQTKGELVRSAGEAHTDFVDGAATTLSCAKLDGRTYAGGNPNLNCGLCIACLTRRASLLEAGLEDRTPYLATTLTGAALTSLRSRRSSDLLALMTRLSTDTDEFVLLENGPYPEDFDLTSAADLCRRGFQELSAILAEVA